MLGAFQQIASRGEEPMAINTASLTVAGPGLGAAIEQLTRDLGLTNEEVAAALGAPPKMMDRWRAGIVAPGPAAGERLRRLSSVHERLYGLFKPHDVLWWLRSPNVELNGQQPASCLASGEFHRVEAAIDHFERAAARW
jgi:hypothetical protein